jgi:hypothetical protein
MKININLREELEMKMNHHSRWFIFNKLTRDYSKAISVIISLSIPTILLLLPYFNEELKKQLNQVFIIISLVGALLSIIPMIFRYDFQAKRNMDILVIAKNNIRLYDQKKINDDVLIKVLAEIDELEHEEEKNW